MARYVIVDPASPEFNRGSFCYLPYILLSALKEEGHEVDLYENFVCENIDTVEWGSYDEILISLWSYPQIESCLVLDRFVEQEVKFFGYKGLIRKYQLEEFEVSQERITHGIEGYFYHFSDFKNILLSDCDMHLTKYPGQVYPLFTSYGCPNNCTFCPTSKNCGRKVCFSSLEAIEKIFDFAAGRGMTNIHFTDEDFFLNIERARKILEMALSIGKTAGVEFRFIALACSSSLTKYLMKYGFDETLDQVKLAEVGYEAANEEILGAMNKQHETGYIIENFKNEIFWLTMTFYPGETIRSLRQTGEFMEQYGIHKDDLYGRVKGNSTVGGLGQFFQAYPDTIGIDELSKSGVILSSRPVRLLPSYVPHSFLEDKITAQRSVTEEEIFWYQYYKVSPPQGTLVGKTIGEAAKSWERFDKAVISLAISAKLGVIK